MSSYIAAPFVLHSVSSGTSVGASKVGLVVLIPPLDRELLRQQWNSAQPFRFIAIDDFLDAGFAARLAASYPSYQRAEQVGREFSALHENLKVQVTDYARFPPEAQQLADALQAPGFLADIEAITGIPQLRWDNQFHGGGMHLTASSGHLDVHVDFNRIEGQDLFRRINLLIYLNEEWDEAWGGSLELWDQDVKKRCHAFVPKLARCVIFETSDISYHGVTAVRCPPNVVRKSFAVYYYTEDAPASYKGQDHNTIFRARPDETKKRYLQMPVAAATRALTGAYRTARRGVRKLVRP